MWRSVSIWSASGLVAIFDEGRQQLVNGPLRPAAAPLGTQSHQTYVDGDAVKPGGQLGAAVESVQRLERAQECFLDGVFRILLAGEHPSSHGQQSAAGEAHEIVERGLLSCPQPRQQEGLR